MQKVTIQARKEFIKIKNKLKIKAPSIFALPEDCLKNILISDQVILLLTKLASLNKMAQSLDKYYISLCNFINEILEREKQTLFRRSNLHPLDVIEKIKIMDFHTYKKDYPEAYEILINYNINCLLSINIAKTSTEYIYMSIEGAYEVDKFLLNYLPEDDEKNNFKFVSFSNQFLIKELKYIINVMNQNLNEISKMKESSSKTLNKIVYEKFLSLEFDHFKIFIRNIFTKTINTINIEKNQKEEENIISDDIEFSYSRASYASVILLLGNEFILTFYDDLIKSQFKLIDIANHIFDYVYDEMILTTKNFNIYKEEFLNSLKIKSQKQKETLIFGSKLSKKDIDNIEKVFLEKVNNTNFPLAYNHLKLIIFLTYNINSWYTKKDIKLKVLKIFLDQQIIKLRSNLGDIICTLFNKFFFIRKTDSKLFINREFHFIINMTHKFPMLGIKQLNNNSITLDEIYTKNKMVFTDLAYSHYDPIIKHSGKYKLHNINQSFIDQLQRTNISLVCHLNMLPVIHFVNALVYFNSQNVEYQEEYIKYLLPKETNMNLLRSTLGDEVFNIIIKFICDLEETSYINFTRKYKIYYLKPLITAIINLKFEIIAIIQILPIILTIYCWRPLTWADARGREYAKESPISLQKSPKIRALFSYVTYTNSTPAPNLLLQTNINNLEKSLKTLEEEIQLLKIIKA